MDVLTVIPARLSSTRLLRKVLMEINGKPLIQHVYEGIKKSKLITKLVIATDSKEIVDCVHKFNGEVMITSSKHKTGTDRVAAVAKQFPEYPIVINIQGDVFNAKPEIVDSLISPFLIDKDIKMTALKSRIYHINDLVNTSVVKVVTDKNNFALYYSRTVIPNIDNPWTVLSEDNKKVNNQHLFYKNMGVYGFKRDFLLEYTKMSQTPLEKTESLEQLRALENGIKIYVTEVDVPTIDINTPRDLEKARGIKEKKKKTPKLIISGK